MKKVVLSILWNLAKMIIGLALVALLPAYISLLPTPANLDHILLAAVSILTYALFIRLFESRWPSEISPKGAFMETAGGISLGFALFSVIILPLFAAGMVDLHIANQTPNLLFHGTFAIRTGILEELMFRLLIFYFLERAFGSAAALLLSSAFFGLSHALNPAATLGSSLAIAIEAGLLLGLCFMLTRRLWLAAGLHMGWNFTQSAIFGVPLSGKPVEGIFTYQDLGPAYLTGGAFGIEAGMASVIMSLLLSLFLWRRVIQQKQWQKPLWSTAPPA